MEITVQPLTKDRVDDYFAFFDHDAFADHPEWSWCYCTFYHFDQALEKEFKAGKDELRQYARTLIDNGTLRGYLAYADGEVVGWCNAGDRTSFRRLAQEKALWADYPDAGAVLSVVCFIVAAAWRRKGVATALLARIIADAKGAGYALIEAYPAHGVGDCYHHFHGHLAMYEANGFAVHAAADGYAVVRFSLGEGA